MLAPLQLLMLLLTGIFCIFAGWRIGLPLRSEVDAPDLPEKIERNRLKIYFFVLLIAFGAPFIWALMNNDKTPTSFDYIYAFLNMVFAILGAMAGNFKTRKIIFEETWSYWEYVNFSFMATIALFGFWILLIVTPVAIHGLGSIGWIAAIPLSILLFLWSSNFSTVTPTIMGSTSLSDDNLTVRFDQVIEKSKVASPLLFESGPQNGSWSNALALPSLKRPAVLFSKPLLRILDTEEAAAIFAHEVAHLEDFDNDFLKKSRIHESLLICLACALPLFLHYSNNNGQSWFGWIWFILVFVYLIRRYKGMQKKETASDLRAIELTGNGEALISALSKLYAANRLPRRMAVEAEANSTHPSLARRIQDIRRAMPKEETPEEEQNENARKEPLERAEEQSTSTDKLEVSKKIFISSEKENEIIILEAKKATWITLNPDDATKLPEIIAANKDIPSEWKNNAELERSVTYSGLLELRLMPQGKNQVIRSVDRSHQQIIFPIKSEDVGAVQQFLDQIDIELAPLSALSNNNQFVGLRLTSFGVAIIGLLASFEGVVSGGTCLWLLFFCIPVLAYPSKKWVGGYAAMAMLTALNPLLMEPDKSWWSTSAWAYLAFIGIAGLWFWFQATIRKNGDIPSIIVSNPTPKTKTMNWSVEATFLIFGGTLIFFQLLPLLDGDVFLKLYSFGVNSIGSFIPIIGAAGAFWHGDSGKSKVFAIIFCTAACPTFFLGSHYFLVNIAKDPLTQNIPQLVPESKPLEHAQTRTLEGEFWGFSISPGGSYFHREHAHSYDEETFTRSYQIADFDRFQKDVKAIKIAFTDDEHFLALVPGNPNPELHKRPIITPDQTIWKIALPDLTLEYDLFLRSNKTNWEIFEGLSEKRTIRHSGKIGGETVEQKHWNHIHVGEIWRYPGKGDNLLEALWGWSKRGEPGSMERIKWIFQRYHEANELTLLTPHKKQLLQETVTWLNIREPEMDNTDAICMARSRKSAEIFLINLENGTFTPIASIATPIFNYAWDGQRLAVVQAKHIFYWDAQTEKATSFDLPRKGDWSIAISIKPNNLALSMPGEKENNFDIFLVPLE